MIKFKDLEITSAVYKVNINQYDFQLSWEVNSRGKQLCTVARVSLDKVNPYSSGSFFGDHVEILCDVGNFYSRPICRESNKEF